MSSASSLDPGPRPDCYFSCDGEEMVSQLVTQGRQRKEKSWFGEGQRCEDVMKKSVLTADFEQKECAPPMFRSKYAIMKEKQVQNQCS